MQLNGLKMLENELKNPKSLSTGSFGCIMKATWIKTRNDIVYKRLLNNQLDAFIHELKIHLRVDHCDQIIRCLGVSQGNFNILILIYIFLKKNNFFINLITVLDPTTKEYLLVMQYANCGDLQSYLKNNFNNLTWDNKENLAIQIASGLNYLHNEDVLHRDLVSITFLCILFDDYNINVYN